MRTRSITIILGTLVASLAMINLIRWSIHAYVGDLSSSAIDPMIGTWEITWDKGTEYEEALVVTADRVMLRRYSAYTSSDGQVRFWDDEGCRHFGTLAPSGANASGIYGECTSEPDWIGSWEARRISD